MPATSPTPSSSPPRALPPYVRRFLDTEASGGIVLVIAAIAALVWANSPWSASYDSLWHTKVSLGIGPFELAEDLRHFVNDALMAVFFLVVGLEIKRELVAGDLRDPRVAALPGLAAVGGMAVPALIYVAINLGGPGVDGWGVPMATDIAFAVGVLALLGPRVPSSLKLFLLTLAVVDDLGAILVIAAFYTEALDAAALGLAVLALGGGIVMRMLRVQWMPPYVLLAIGCWYALYESGVHPTLAGVAFGLLAPATPLAPTEIVRGWAQDLSDDATPAEIREMTAIANSTVSVAERIEHALHPVSSFVIVPGFALANAGVEISGDALRPEGAPAVAAGVLVGLLFGKVLGVFGVAWLAVRSGIASLPHEVTWSQLAGVATLAGVGFTVSLFIAGLAFDDPALEVAATLAVLVASIVASAVGGLILLLSRPAATEASDQS
jgi:NhaA family Na+:H+ antiporter